MGRLTRDGTAEPVWRDQILRRARGQGNIIFPVQLATSRIGNLTRLIHTLLYVMTIHTYILRLNLVLTGFLPSSAAASIYLFKPPYAIGSVPSLKKKLNASKPPELSPSGGMSKYLGGNIGCRDKSS